MGLIFSEKKSFGPKEDMRMGNGLCAAIPCSPSVRSRWTRDASGKEKKMSSLTVIYRCMSRVLQVDHGKASANLGAVYAVQMGFPFSGDRFVDAW